jgi:hypothetical protein
MSLEPLFSQLNSIVLACFLASKLESTLILPRVLIDDSASHFPSECTEKGECTADLADIFDSDGLDALQQHYCITTVASARKGADVCSRHTTKEFWSMEALDALRQEGHAIGATNLVQPRQHPCTRNTLQP